MTVEVSTPPRGSVDELLLGILRPAFEPQGVTVRTQWTQGLAPPIILARRERRSGTVSNRVKDERFLEPAIVAIETITDGVDADEVGEELQEAVRAVLREAHLNQTVIPNGGAINRMEISSLPSRVSDWATSTGVVQYAQLPDGQVRYESILRILVRPPHPSTITNRFLSYKPR